MKKDLSKKLISAILQILLMVSGFNSFAQSQNKVAEIKKINNEAKMSQIRSKYGREWAEGKRKAVEYASKNNLQIRIETDDYVTELVKIDFGGMPIYYQTSNEKAAISTRTNFLNNTLTFNGGLLGQNMTIGVWDDGHPRASHQEFSNIVGKVIIGDADNPTINFHAAHVTGTITASGLVNGSATGMAPLSKVKAYDWDFDIFEAADEVMENGLLLSNHSYGYNSRFLSENNYSFVFGAYVYDSKDWDELMHAAPYYLMVASAGNDGATSYNKDPLDPLNPEYDKLSGMATSKNNLVIAASNAAEISSNGDLINVSMASFSSQGPTDDFRIKPDLTGQGVSLFSTGHLSDQDYFAISGTSMSSPNVSGTLLLIQEASERLNQKFLKAATLKGLVLHTADNIGQPGPDAISGWGLLNAKKAIDVLTESGSSSMVLEMKLEPNQEFILPIQANGKEPLSVSIS